MSHGVTLWHVGTTLKTDQCFLVAWRPVNSNKNGLGPCQSNSNQNNTQLNAAAKKPIDGGKGKELCWPSSEVVFYRAHVQSLAMLGPGPIVAQTEAALGWNVFPSGVGAASWS